MTTSADAHLKLTVAGIDCGVWDSLSGGDATASVTPYRPGGGKTVIDAVQSTVNDVTLARRHVLTRDVDLVKQLTPLVGKGEAVLTEQPLDPDGVTSGKPTTYTGLLTGCDGGSVDSNSTDTRMVTLTIAVETKV